MVVRVCLGVVSVGVWTGERGCEEEEIGKKGFWWWLGEHVIVRQTFQVGRFCM